MKDLETEAIEMALLLEAMFRKYGYDFRNYAQASLERRLWQCLSRSKLESITAMTHRLLYDREFFESLVHELSISVTEMFRDPPFYQALRERVLPVLSTYPFLRVWVAGCATGEEVYSLAILLKEAGLESRSRIYATDMNQSVLDYAQKGIYPIDHIKAYTENYQKAGGREEFSNYYTAHYESVALDPSLKKNVTFAAHNLVFDGVFNEMHLISCRNVFIYFNRELQNQVLGLFHESLVRDGFFCLGDRETLRFSQYEQAFDTIAADEKIYKKKSV